MEHTGTQDPQSTTDNGEEPFEYPAPEGMPDASEEPLQGLSDAPEPDLPAEPDPLDEPEPEPEGDPSGGHVDEPTPAQSVADLAAGAEDEKPPPPPPVEGTYGQLSLDVGGQLPDTSTVKLMSVSREVEGEFSRGETVTFLAIARCGEIDFVDTVDTQAVVTKPERRHIFRVESVRRGNVAALVAEALKTEEGQELARRTLANL